MWQTNTVVPNTRYLLNTNFPNNGKKNLGFLCLDTPSEQYLKRGLSIVVDSSVKTFMKLALVVSEKHRMHEI